jgi:membrane associated rhomboid family serine protease
MNAPGREPGGGERAGAPAGTLRAWLSRSHARTAIVASLGAIAAAAYAHFVGCKTGTCFLTSSVWSASVFGAVVGAVVGWPSRDPAKK